MFEVADDQWGTVRQRIREQLVATATQRTTITYSEVAAATPQLEGPHSHALAHMLGEISAADGRAHGMLSAITVLKGGAGAGTPGEGFWNAAVDYPSLGYSEKLKNRQLETLRLQFWLHELERVYEEYADGRPPRPPLDAVV